MSEIIGAIFGTASAQKYDMAVTVVAVGVLTVGLVVTSPLIFVMDVIDEAGRIRQEAISAQQ